MQWVSSPEGGMQSKPSIPPRLFPRQRWWATLLFKKPHANFRWHRIQDQNCNDLFVTFSIFSSFGGKNTTEGIKWLFSLYVLLVFCCSKEPTQPHSLLQKLIPLLVKALSRITALVSELATQLAQINISCINDMPASTAKVFQK